MLEYCHFNTHETRVAVMRYWTHIFTEKTWNHFIHSGGSVVEYRLRRWSTVQEIAKGDIMFGYIGDLKTFAGVLTVTDVPYKDGKQSSWFGSNGQSCFVPVNVLAQLQFEDWVPVVRFQNQLSYLREAQSLSEAIESHFIDPPIAEAKKDAIYVLRRLRGTIRRRLLEDTKSAGQGDKPATDTPQQAPAQTRPTPPPQPAPPPARPVQPPQPAPPRPVVAQPTPADEDDVLEQYTEEGVEADASYEVYEAEEAAPPTNGSGAGTFNEKEMIWFICEVGQEIGVGLWLPEWVRREKLHDDVSFEAFDHLIHDLPETMDEGLREMLREVDVLWMKEGRVVSVFDVEQDENVLAGLVRLNDINLARPERDLQLYIVAPRNMRDHLQTQICRPSFVSSAAPLVNGCRFVPYEALRVKIRELENLGLLKYIQPNFLEEIATDF